MDAEFNYETDVYGNVVETYLDRYIQSCTISFTPENLNDIFSNQIIEYEDPERNKKGVKIEIEIKKQSNPTITNDDKNAKEKKNKK